MSGVDATATSPSMSLASALEASTLDEGCEGILSIGTDVVSVTRMARLVSEGGPAFLGRGWTPGESAEADGNPERLATRWAAKEAVMKCLGLGISDLDPREIEIASSESGAPSVTLRGSAAKQAQSLGISKFHVSASHESGWATAVAAASAIPIQRESEMPHQRKDQS